MKEDRRGMSAEKGGKINKEENRNRRDEVERGVGEVLSRGRTVIRRVE